MNQARTQVESLVELARELTQHGTRMESLHEFFSLGLLPYYNPMNEDGMAGECGDIIYRLSDYVDKDVRKTIPIYPDSLGEIIRNESKWESLEQWREGFLKQRITIPLFTISLSEHVLKLLVSSNSPPQV